MAYSPICLPTKSFLNKDLTGFKVKVSGYGEMDPTDYNPRPNACELQVATTEIVSSRHKACTNVSSENSNLSKFVCVLRNFDILLRSQLIIF